jgi:hypothetical protein
MQEAGLISVDRYSFWFSVVIAIGGFAYINSHRISPALDADIAGSFVFPSSCASSRRRHRRYPSSAMAC